MGSTDKHDAAFSHYSTLPEFMYNLASLTNLYEIGLAVGGNTDMQDIRQHILTHLSRPIRARGACLLLYHAARQHFIVVASHGDKLPTASLINTIDGREMEQVAMRGPGETLTTLHIDKHHVVLITLTYNASLLGLVALLTDDENPLPDERGLLLTYLGNVAALLLRNADLHQRERQAVVDLERTRIARDLHDGVAQYISHALHKLEYIQHLLEKQQFPLIPSEVLQVQHVLQNSLHDLRIGIDSLLPRQLAKQGDTDELEALIASYRHRHPDLTISYTFGPSTELQRVPSHLVGPIIRLVQEALSNTCKHAHATHVSVHLRLLPASLVLKVSDNGSGFQPAPALSTESLIAQEVHFGLRMMRERVEEVGGTWELCSKPGAGTTIEAHFPLATPLTALTRRERDVLHLMGAGLSNQAIAQRLSISSSTIKTHILHIMQKVHAKDRAQAVDIAARNGWL